MIFIINISNKYMNILINNLIIMILYQIQDVVMVNIKNIYHKIYIIQVYKNVLLCYQYKIKYLWIVYHYHLEILSLIKYYLLLYYIIQHQNLHELKHYQKYIEYLKYKEFYISPYSIIKIKVISIPHKIYYLIIVYPTIKYKPIPSPPPSIDNNHVSKVEDKSIKDIIIYLHKNRLPIYYKNLILKY